MQRVTLTLDDDLLDAVDALTQERGYTSRSEAVRDLLRDVIGRKSREDGDAEAFATLSYIFDHHKRDLAKRLLQTQHNHHGLAVASLHVHLDHDTCLETVVLRGPAARLIALSDAITAQRGVRYGQLHLIPGIGEPQPDGVASSTQEAAE